MNSLVLLLLSTHLAISFPHAQKLGANSAYKPGWHKIGHAKIDFKADKNNFILNGTGRFKCLQIITKDVPVLIEYVQIEYKGKVKEEIALGSELTGNSGSTVIKHKNSNSGIKNVTFIYRMLPNSGNIKAQLELWGLK